MVTELMRIRRAHGLTSKQVAEAAQVALRVEYLCEIGGWIEEEEARKVLAALSLLTGLSYSLETVELNLKPARIEDAPTLPLPRMPGSDAPRHALAGGMPKRRR